ncbi:hypothetical protein HY212_04590 [Candidatus Pacearchaeota archaeon]|nr:hypothetical protein [Candidatus Pacearchaeota archaeon]
MKNLDKKFDEDYMRTLRSIFRLGRLDEEDISYIRQLYGEKVRHYK